MIVPSVGKSGHQSPPHTSGNLRDSVECNTSTQLAASSVLSLGCEAADEARAKHPSVGADSDMTSREQTSQQAFEVKHLSQNGSGDCAPVSQARGPPVEPVHVNGLNGRPEAGDVGTGKHADRDWSRHVRPSTYPNKDREKERDTYRRHYDHNGGGDGGRDRYGDGYGHRGDRESRPPRPRSGSRERYRRDSDRYRDRHRYYHHRDHNRGYYGHHRHRSRGDRDREREHERRPAVGEYNHHRGSRHREDSASRWGGEEGRTRPHHAEEEEQLSNRAKPSAYDSNSNSHNSSASSGHAGRKRSLEEDHSEERQVKKHKSLGKQVATQERSTLQ